MACRLICSHVGEIYTHRQRTIRESPPHRIVVMLLRLKGGSGNLRSTELRFVVVVSEAAVVAVPVIEIGISLPDY